MADSPSIQDMQASISAARDAEEIFLGVNTIQPEELSPGFIKDCLHNNERGDGILFARMHRNNFVMVKNWGQAGKWLHWTGHHWEIDKFDLATNAVEQVADTYALYAASLDSQIKDAQQKASVSATQLRVAERDKALDDEALQVLTRSCAMDQRLAKALAAEQKKAKLRVDKLRSVNGARNCLEWAHKIGDQSLSILGDLIDLHHWLLPCNNGVVDLRTGKLTAGRPGDYLLRAIPIDWNGIDAPCPAWDAFFSEIHQHDQEIIDYLDRLFGYTLTGLTVNHFIGIFLGEGRNGKGTMFETLRHLMGDLAWNVSPELLLEQKNARSSAGPSPDLMSLHGRRMVIASESDEHRRISLQQVKRLTGNDTINARSPHDRDETNIIPTWKLFFYTNHIPKGLTSDFAIQQRLVYLNYPLKFVDSPDPSDPNQRPRDPGLPEKLRLEASGILARLVRGCLMWQELKGLFPPDKIRADVDALRTAEDPFQQFFDEQCTTNPEGVVGFGDLYAAFSTWYADEISEHDKWRPTKKAISAWLTKRGFERRKPSGTATVYGLSLHIGGLL